MSQGNSEDDEQIDFCTLGMLIIDEIHFTPPRLPSYNITGGAGTYAAMGARLFRPGPKESRKVGWIVDAGNDFPLELREVIASWQTGCVVRETPERKTTRGWNGYFGERRAFEYTTPKLRLDESSLTNELLTAKVFHVICSPQRCIQLVTGIRKRVVRVQQREGHDQVPLFVWEPVPDVCTPEQLEKCYEALKHVDVVSPNHTELCAFFGNSAEDDQGNVARSLVQKHVQEWIAAGVGQSRRGWVAVRAGKEGCYLASRLATTWMPAYYESVSDKVVDPTGAGNAFMGGLAVGLKENRMLESIDEFIAAAAQGSVAASFAIEQVGLPILGESREGETWNGDIVQRRLDSYRQRILELV